jgi:hypothetical protein
MRGATGMKQDPISKITNTKGAESMIQEVKQG